MWRRWEGRRPTGIDRVCLAYLEHFSSEAQAVVQHRRLRRIFDQCASKALFEILAAPEDTFRRRLIEGLLRHGLRRGCAGSGRLYLNVGHTGLHDQGYRAWLQRAAVRPIYFVHDLIPITHAQFCRAGEADKHRDRIRTVLQTGVGVIGNSVGTLDELRSFAASEDLPFPAAIAALLGSDAVRRRTPPRSASDRATFVVLGTIEGRKNHLLLLKIWTRLVRQFGRDAPRLLIIGQRGWECDDVFDLLDRSDALRGAVAEISHCDDETLADHLSGARALLFPSFAEGYGLPLVEALKLGVPVIASDLPVFREIAGDIPDYLDPLDQSAWERTIVSYAGDPSPARASQLDRLRDFCAPTWKSHFATVDQWIRSL